MAFKSSAGRVAERTADRDADRNADRDAVRLLTGRGRYVHDVDCPGMLHAVFVRSMHACARLAALDTAAARACDGVVAILTGEDLDGLTMPPPNPLVANLRAVAMPLLAADRVDSVGQPIALVVAATLLAAQSAAEQVLVDYAEEAGQAGQAATAAAPPVAAIAHRNGDVEASARRAVHRVQVEQRQPRVVAMSLEPRAAVAAWEAAGGGDPCDDGGTLTVWLPTQAPARARTDIAFAVGLDRSRVRVIAPDVGGAVGSKASVSPEDLVVACAARRLRAAVKWQSPRTEEFTAGMHGRGARLAGELWLDGDGHFVHLRARLAFSLGAWLPFSAVVPARNAARILPGPYRVASVDIAAEARRSNQAAVNIYRGAGRPEAALLMERLVEVAARASGIDPVELRRRNLIEAAAMPYATPTGEQFDAGDYAAALDRACARFDYPAERCEQARRRAGGALVGIGIACYVEPCGQGWEAARVTLAADGSVEVASGAPAQGQGHAASFAAIAAEALGCPVARVRVIAGDTAQCPDGIGALASRSIAIGGSAVLQAARAAAERRDHGEALPIVADTIYTAPGEGWSYGCVIARLAIDRDTGGATVERIVWIDDAGRIISPLSAENQLLGGLAQGVGQAMLERIVYDDAGQLLTGSLLDYAVPRADDLPPLGAIELESMAVPTEVNLLGAKGVGEAGCIGVPAALLNAAADALAPLMPGGIEPELEFPLTAEQLWRAIRGRANIA
ncbi:MAG: xanthine dehydrogenase family protein molybdopterin-binding subunit [Lautropia sp.]